MYPSKTWFWVGYLMQLQKPKCEQYPPIKIIGDYTGKSWLPPEGDDPTAFGPSFLGKREYIFTYFPESSGFGYYIWRNDDQLTCEKYQAINKLYLSFKIDKASQGQSGYGVLWGSFDCGYNGPKGDGSERTCPYTCPKACTVLPICFKFGTCRQECLSRGRNPIYGWCCPV